MCRDSMAVASSNVEILSYEYSAPLNVRFMTVVLYLALVYLFPIKGKVKCTLVQALRLCTGRTAHRGSGGTAVPFHDHGTRRG